MSGFSAAWLRLREPVDHVSRAAGLAQQVRARFANHAHVGVVDVGCGTGSNLRATSRLLPNSQSWTLVDYDQRLLDEARAALTAWADRSGSSNGKLLLHAGPQRIEVGFRQADLNADLDGALVPIPHPDTDLITASAFFDLCSPAFIARFAEAVCPRRAAFYTVLTYNGEQRWTPAHAADLDMAKAFHAHQQTDKGFATAVGPLAPAALARALRGAGYRVAEGDSPWVLDASHHALIGDLAAGFAGAVEETGHVLSATLADWRSLRRTGAVVGHTDTFAVPE